MRRRRLRHGVELMIALSRLALGLQMGETGRFELSFLVGDHALKLLLREVVDGLLDSVGDHAPRRGVIVTVVAAGPAARVRMATAMGLGAAAAVGTVQPVAV